MGEKDFALYQYVGASGTVVVQSRDFPLFVVVFGVRGKEARAVMESAGFPNTYRNSFYFRDCTVDQAAAVLRLQGFTVIVERSGSNEQDR